MKRVFACLFLMMAIPWFSQAQVNPFVTDSLDSYIEKGMKDWQIPGLALAIVKDGTNMYFIITSELTKRRTRNYNNNH